MPAVADVDLTELTAVTAPVNVETLEVVPRQRMFTRLQGRRWRYASPFSGLEVESELDEYGIVIDEPGAFSRRLLGVPGS